VLFPPWANPATSRQNSYGTTLALLAATDNKEPQGAQKKACALSTANQVESSEIPCPSGLFQRRTRTSCPRQRNASIASVPSTSGSPEHHIRLGGCQRQECDTRSASVPCRLFSAFSQSIRPLLALALHRLRGRSRKPGSCRT